MNFSVTMTGILVAVVGPMLLKLGFSEVCTNEIVTFIPLLIGGGIAWWGRVRAGGVKWTGART